MGILIRLLLLLYVLAVMAALGVSAGVYLHLIPTKFWQNELNAILASQDTLIVLIVMLLASVCLLCAIFSGSKKVETVLSGDVELKKGEVGEVAVTIGAITSVVERAALSVSGVREVKADVYKQTGESPIKVSLSIILGQNFSAPEVSANINSAVNDALQVALQISGVPVEVKVTEVTHAVIERERRVV